MLPFYFVGLWCFVSVVLSRLGGWHRLAGKYLAATTAAGHRYGMQSMQLGLVNYSGCLTLHVSDGGIHLAVWLLFRLAHPPLFIPWSEMRNAVVKKHWWVSSVEVEIGEERIVKMSLSRKVFAGHEDSIGLGT